MPFSAICMVPEIIILSEISQREANIIGYCLYVELKKNTNELIYKTETDPQTTESKLVIIKGGRDKLGGREKLGGWD